MIPRVDTRARRRNSGRAAEARSFSGHLKWLRGRPCACAARHAADCSGKIEAAHVDRAGGKGVSLKVADYHAVPLCAGHHAEYHRGAATFEAASGLDLVAVAERYAAASPHRAAWEHLR
ncbi:DUF968 domain-containing protein [Sphingomonas bacterium]|uniref:DUF968 domain-containing protein n=1 Tax=Sphingomonas bacterium TaxID=1895847 RepID=UPI0015770A5E|nr:DUF968 domain-containing protein [Sphingomonas bacterium]